MTYCIGMLTSGGLVMLADTRTNAGVDNIATFRKLTVFRHPSERVIMLMSSGNLAITQAVVSLLEEGLELDEHDPAEGGNGHTLLSVPSMFQAARLVGQAVRDVYRADAEALRQQDTPFIASFMLGGQIRGRRMRLFQIYSAGNFIEATPDTPYLQIGENKYGKPILDRAMHYEIDLLSAVKLSLISMDSTMRSNMSVGMPLDLAVLPRDTQELSVERRVGPDDDYYAMLQQSWSEALRGAYARLPSPPWMPEA